MNTGRFLGAAAGVWIVRVVLNGSFYGKVVGSQLQQMASDHPGIFKQGITGFVVTDLIFALAFAFLFTKVGSALGGGVKAGVTLGILVAILSPVIGSLYEFFTFTFSTIALTTIVMIFQIIALAIEGAVAGAIYKSSPA